MPSIRCGFLHKKNCLANNNLWRSMREILSHFIGFFCMRYQSNTVMCNFTGHTYLSSIEPKNVPVTFYCRILFLYQSRLVNNISNRFLNLAASAEIVVRKRVQSLNRQLVQNLSCKFNEFTFTACQDMFRLGLFLARETPEITMKNHLIWIMSSTK